MAFITIPSSWITVGKAVKKEIFEYIKNNFDDHETRINSIEAGTSKVELFNFEVIGYINNYTALELTGIGTFRAPINLILTNAKLTLLNSASCPVVSSANGVLAIDLQKSSDNGVTWTSILVQRPEIGDGVYATGSESGIFTFITNGEIVNQDDLIRVNVYSKKDSQGSFLITVYGEIS